MAEKELAILITARSLASRVIKGTQRELGNLEKIGSKAAHNVGQNIGKIALAGTLLAAGGGLMAIKWAGDFEADLHTINTIARVTPDKLAGIGDGIRKLARNSGADLQDLTSAYYDLLSAGIATKDAQNVLTQAVHLGVGALATTGESVNLLTTALNSYNLSGGKATYVADLFAKAVEIGKVKASEIAATIANVAPIAHTAGIKLEEIAASYGALTSQGVPAAEVTTQMSRAILELIKPSATVVGLQKKLHKSYVDIAKEKGLHVALVELRADATKAHIPLGKLFGRVEGYKYLLATTGSQQAIYDQALLAMGHSAGTAASQFDERQQGLNYELARIKALAQDAGITIGSKLLPKLTPLLAELAHFLDTHQDDIGIFGDKLAKGMSDVADSLKGVDWTAVGGGLTVAGKGAKMIVDSFIGAPPWVQGFLAGGFAADKFTGGLLSDVLKGVVKGVLGITAAVVNVNGGVVNGGGGLPGVPGEGKGGGIGGAFGKGATFILPIAAAVAIVAAIKLASGRSLDDPNEQSGQFGPRNASQKSTDTKLAALVAEAAKINAGVLSGPQMIEEAIRTAQRTEATADRIREAGSTSAITRAELSGAERIQAEIDRAAGRTKAATTATGYVVAGAAKHAGMGAAGAATHAGQVVAGAARSAGATARSGGLAAAHAIDRKHLSVTINTSVAVTTKLSSREVMSFLAKHKIYKNG